jgi:hypothetical protein
MRMGEKQRAANVTNSMRPCNVGFQIKKTKNHGKAAEE